MLVKARATKLTLSKDYNIIFRSGRFVITHKGDFVGSFNTFRDAYISAFNP